MAERIFDDDWRACQREHLRTVMAAGDSRNVTTLVQVLREIGFGEADLDLEPDAASLAADAGLQSATAVEDVAPVMEDVPEPFDKDDADDVNEALENGPEDSGPPDDGDAPAQLSLF